MLTALLLRDFVIVDALEIELASGFTALTGETGAGKSILVDALGLALDLGAWCAAAEIGLLLGVPRQHRHPPLHGADPCRRDRRFARA